MKYRLNRIDPWSAAKTMAAIYCIGGLAAFGFELATHQIDSDPQGLIYSLLAFSLLIPGVAFISTVFVCALFNFVAKRSGGIEINLENDMERRAR